MDDDDSKHKKELDSESDESDVEQFVEKKPRLCVPTKPIKCENNDYPKAIVLYARMGVHRYNMIQGTKLQFSCIEEFRYLFRVVYRSFYITVVAKDPSAAGDSLVTFKMTAVEEEGCGIKSLSCNITSPNLAEDLDQPSLNKGRFENCYSVTLPEWPSENTFNDITRYYVLKKSELRKYDWIRLYMELAFLKANTDLTNPNLSKLDIVKVAVETSENVETPNERVKARNATFYIKYKYYPNIKGQASKVHARKPPRDRIAVVRRTVKSRLLSLFFKGHFAQTLL